MRVLIIGCGYVGVALGRRLRESAHEVFGLRRSEAATAEFCRHGIKPLTGDVTNAASLAALPGEFEWVVNTVSSSRGDDSDYQKVYLEGTRNLIPWLRRWGCRRYAYTSSTSVYAQCDGSEVTEDSPAEPTALKSRILVATERELVHAVPPLPFPSGVFRVAGIYGPGRGHLYRQFLRGEAKLTGDGSRLINMVHRDDVASALAAYFGAPNLKSGVQLYNLVDNAPVPELEFFQWLSCRLGLPMPPAAPAMEIKEKKRATTQKRVSNSRLRQELHWQPHYPTYREGYEALISQSTEAIS